MLIAALAVAPSGPNTLSDVVTIASATFGILGSLYLAYDLVTNTFLRRLTQGLALGIPLAVIAGILSLILAPTLCTHITCQAVESSPLYNAGSGLALGLVVGFAAASVRRTVSFATILGYLALILVVIVVVLAVLLLVLAHGWAPSFLGVVVGTLTGLAVGLLVTPLQLLIFPAVEDLEHQDRLRYIGLICIGIAFLIQILPPVIDLAFPH